ncbi:histidine phosphatase family protein [Clostridiaceae bacterium M8S5]|nr:histidine phosphatase family protein [Clostridiaceae bacterium M8S5]
MKLYITRHGQTEWNSEGRLQGQQNSALTELGKKQAIWLGNKLIDEHIDIIISSSSERAINTAKLIRGDRDIEIITTDNLKELHMGKWQGMLFKDIKEIYADDFQVYTSTPHLFKPEYGESIKDIYNRASSEIEAIIKTHSDKNVLIVTHGITLKAIIAYFENKKIEDFWSGPRMESTCLNILEVDGENRNFTLQGDISHWVEEN